MKLYLASSEARIWSPVAKKIPASEDADYSNL